MKDWLKNMLHIKNKLLPLVAVDCCLRKWKKMAFTNPKKAGTKDFVEKEVSTRR